VQICKFNDMVAGERFPFRDSVIADKRVILLIFTWIFIQRSDFKLQASDIYMNDNTLKTASGTPETYDRGP